MTEAINPEQRAKLTARAALLSIAMALTLIALKTYAALHTSSMAMLGSLADSGLDLVASMVVLLGVRIAAQPADYDHRFGHGKAEALASLVQVILISLSAIFIAFRAVQRLLARAETADAELGIGVSIIAIVLTAALITYQRHVVRQTGSVAIGTDRLHYSSDLMLNGSVIVALALDQFARLRGADAVFGVLIALWLLFGAWASDQSRPLDSRATFEQRLEEVKRRFEGEDVPRPPHWGGYRVVPARIEFWTDRPHRLHERRLFILGNDGWSEGLLYP